MRSGHTPANWEVAVYALYLLGGAEKRAHTEEVALKAHQLAPAQFCWRTQPGLADCDIARVSLSDAAKAKNGARVSMEGPSEREGMWLLTASGLGWVQQNEERIRQALRRPQDRPPREYKLRQLHATMTHPAFAKFCASRSCAEIEDYEFAESLRCTVNTPPATLRARLDEVRTQAVGASQSDVQDYLDACEERFAKMLE